jgi:DNA-binding NtrC family response regulator
MKNEIPLHVLDELDRKLGELTAECKRAREILAGIRSCLEPPVFDLGGLTLKQIERGAIKQALELAQGNRREAAKLLGISERTLYRRILGVR